MDPLNADLNSISKKLRLSTMDFDNEDDDMSGKFKELMQRAGK
jgi:hypothetical protein